VTDNSTTEAIRAAAPTGADSSGRWSPAAPSRRWVRIGLGVGVTLLLVAPALVAVARLAGRSWLPVDDFGITDLRVRDVFTANTPLTGLYSRPGWNHPGPLMFWLIGLVAAPFGSAPWAVRISGAVIQGVALAWLGWVTWQRGLQTFLAAAAVTALTFLAFAPSILTRPWNPNIPISCFILFLYLTVLAADGWFRQLIALSVVGNVIMQIHISYASFVVVCLAWVVGWTLRDARRDHRAPERWRSTVVISAAVWVVAWSFPVIDVVVNRPGNLGKIARYFAGGNHATVGLRAAAGIMADEFRWIPNWLGEPTRVDALTGHAVGAPLAWLLVPTGLLVLGFVAAWHVGSRPHLRRVSLAAVLLLVGIIAISSADEPRAYTFGWRAVIAAFVVVTCLWAVAAAVRPRVSRPLGLVATGVVLALVVWSTLDMSVAVSSSAEYSGLEQRGPALGVVMDQLRHDGLPARSVILVEPVGPNLPSLFDGMIDALDRAGVDVRVNPTEGRIFGEQRTALPRQADEIWRVAELGSYVPALLARPGARLVARTTPLTRRDEREIARLQQQLLGELRAAGRMDLRTHLDSSLFALAVASVPGVDRSAAARLAALNQKVQRSGGCRCAIVATPGPDR
jgi:hypothetical protein